MTGKGFFRTLPSRKRPSFFVDSDPAHLSEKIRGSIRSANPRSVDGFTCFVHGRSPVIMGTINDIGQNMNLILFGMGFLYDETLMIRNTYGNLFNGRAKIYKRPKIPSWSCSVAPSSGSSALLSTTSTGLRPRKKWRPWKASFGKKLTAPSTVCGKRRSTF